MNRSGLFLREGSNIQSSVIFSQSYMGRNVLSFFIGSSLKEKNVDDLVTIWRREVVLMQELQIWNSYMENLRTAPSHWEVRTLTAVIVGFVSASVWKQPIAYTPKTFIVICNMISMDTLVRKK